MKSFFLLILISTLAFGQVERIEPPFWWEGMNNTQLQLMLYGSDIADYQIRIPALDSIITHQVENPNYLFIDLDLAQIKAGKLEFQLYKEGKIQSQFDYEIKLREQRPSIESFNSSDVIYTKRT